MHVCVCVCVDADCAIVIFLRLHPRRVGRAEERDVRGDRRGSRGTTTWKRWAVVVSALDRKSTGAGGGDGGRNSGREGERVLAGRERVRAPRKDQGPRQT